MNSGTEVPDRRYGPAVPQVAQRVDDSVARAVATGLADLLARVYDRLAPLAQTTRTALEHGGPRRSSLAPVEPLVRQLLGATDAPVAGAGFVAEPGLLEDASHWLEWWTAGEDRVATRLEVEPETALEYARQPWLTVPRATGRRHLTGPYVDYVCTDEYSLTLSVPVTVHGAFAGIVGADVFVRHVEAATARDLDRVGERVALVNASGRVLAGTGDLLTGALVRTVPVAALFADGADVVASDGAVLYRCAPDLPLGLLVLA